MPEAARRVEFKLPEVVVPTMTLVAPTSDVITVVTPAVTPTPVPLPTLEAAVAAEALPIAPTQQALGLTSAGMDEVLHAAGWPVELWEQARLVSWCETLWQQDVIGDSGGSLGLFQLNRMWFAYAGEDINSWNDPVVNARAAYSVYLYDIQRGNPAWWQWTCRKELR